MSCYQGQAYLSAALGCEDQDDESAHGDQVDDEAAEERDVRVGGRQGTHDEHEDGAGGEDGGDHEEALVGDVQQGDVLVLPGH